MNNRVKICPKCGKANPPWMEFCQQCFQSLVDIPFTYQDADHPEDSQIKDGLSLDQAFTNGDGRSDSDLKMSPPPSQPSLPLMEAPEMEHPASKQVQPQPANPVTEALGAGALAGVAAGVAAHFLSGGKLTYGVWIVAYLLVITTVKNKLLATLAFVVVASFVSVLAGVLFPAG
jgi:hypothetical protein